MSTSGSLAIIIAIIARWRMPPENSCGYCRTRTSGRGIPTESSSSTARSIASFSLRSRRCARIASVICLPTRCTGFSAVSGSWKIIAILAPRICCSSFGLRPISSSPRNFAEPVIVGRPRQQPQRREHRDRLARARLADDAEHLARGDVEIDAPHRVDRTVLGVERDVQVADLEDRLAPRPGAGSSAPSSVGDRLHFGRRWPSDRQLLRIERVAQAVTDEVHAQHRDHDREAREPTRGTGTMSSRSCELLSRLPHVGVKIGVDAEAEERQRRLGEDRGRDRQRRVDDDLARCSSARRWRNMIRKSEAPAARAASTNSFSFSDSTSPRMIARDRHPEERCR